MSRTKHIRTPSVAIGTDLGGTDTRIVALEQGGAVYGEHIMLTRQRAGSIDAVVDPLVDQIRATAGAARISTVGIGASGPIDADGIIRNDDTLPAFSHIPLCEAISDRLGVPCVIDNDAVTAALGESAQGAGKGARSVLMITLGTGIGVALVVDGRPVRAVDGTHPEAGHIPVAGTSAPCYCGLPTCWEQLASRTALDQLTCDETAEFAARAAAGDTVASSVFDIYGVRVAAGLGVLLTLSHPARVVLGGSAAQYLPLFSPALQETLRRSPGFSWNPPLHVAALGALSGAIGAAVMAGGSGGSDEYAFQQAAPAAL
jgi:glucokinase